MSVGVCERRDGAAGGDVDHLVQRRDDHDRRVGGRLCKGGDRPGPDLSLEPRRDGRLSGRCIDVRKHPIDSEARFHVAAVLLSQRRLPGSRQEIQAQIGSADGIRLVHRELFVSLCSPREGKRNHPTHQTENGRLDRGQPRAGDICCLRLVSPTQALPTEETEEHAGEEASDEQERGPVVTPAGRPFPRRCRMT